MLIYGKGRPRQSGTSFTVRMGTANNIACGGHFLEYYDAN